MVAVRLIGGPTAVLEYGGLRLVTDPTFDPAGEYPSPTGAPTYKTGEPSVPASGLGHVDAVLLSHDQHPDNFDGSGRVFAAGVPLVLTTPAGAARLGGNAHGLSPWQTRNLLADNGSSVTVTAVPALHGPEGAERVLGAVTGFVLTAAGLPTVYVSGDNASLPVVREIAERIGRVDVAVLFAGGARRHGLLDGALLTLDSASAAQAADILRAGTVIPVHFEQWRHLSEGAEALRAAFRAVGLDQRLILLAPGERVELPANQQTGVRRVEHRYGPGARNRLAEAGTPIVDGARAALESFYTKETGSRPT
ncbi:MAG: MBL fold metallo-hydrolase [Sciscionella sp.]|nr:MBL fold metallo-hydrolase [Sciscionella sp.]